MSHPILHIPHSSKTVPEDLLETFALRGEELELELLKMTDHFTDVLFGCPPELVTTVAFPVSRLVVDPERFENDDDEPMAALGMGVLYTRTSCGEVLREAPGQGEREALLDRFYRPHHLALHNAVMHSLASSAGAVIIDGHSFPSKPLPYEPDQSQERPQICLGTDEFHTPPWLTETARLGFESLGYEVALDRPFSGAIVPFAFYRRRPEVASLMIEIRRDLYMNEATGQPRDHFDTIHDGLSGVIEQIAARASRELGPATPA